VEASQTRTFLKAGSLPALILRERVFTVCVCFHSWSLGNTVESHLWFWNESLVYLWFQNHKWLSNVFAKLQWFVEL